MLRVSNNNNYKKGKLIKHSQPCEHCGSSDAVSYYENDEGEVNGWCFSCKTFIKEENETILESAPKKISVPFYTPGEKCRGLEDRRISRETCAKYGIRSEYSIDGKEIERYYPVYKNGDITGYKKRVLPKDFSKGKIGDISGEVQLFGQNLFSAGKTVIVTAGEEDAMASYEITKYKSKINKGIPSVSLPNGCNKRSVLANLEWLNSFEKVIFAVDQESSKDLKDAEEFCRLFSPGKACIARFSEKDVSDMCKNGKFSEFYSSLFDARPYTPAGLVTSSQTWNVWQERDEYEAVPFPAEWGLAKYGDILRIGSLITVGAGTGQGKTTLFKELEYHVFKNTNYNIGIIHLEEPLCDTVGGLMGIHMNKRLNVNTDNVPEEQQKKAWDELFNSNRFMFDQAFGHLDVDGLVDKIRYMAHVGKCKFIFIDHLSALTSMYGTDSRGSKLEKTEKLVISLQMLTQELDICIVLASHVRKREDTSMSYENGAVPNLDSLYGSSSVKNYSDAVLAIQRDQRVENSPVIYHVIKNRLAGSLGPGNQLIFNFDTGRIESIVGINNNQEIM